MFLGGGSRSSKRSEPSSSSRKHKSDSSSRSHKHHRRSNADRSPSRKSTRAGDDRDDEWDDIESVHGGPPVESMISAPRTAYFETSTPWPSSSKKYDTPEESLKTRRKSASAEEKRSSRASDRDRVMPSSIDKYRVPDSSPEDDRQDDRYDTRYDSRMDSRYEAAPDLRQSSRYDERQPLRDDDRRESRYEERQSAREDERRDSRKDRKSPPEDERKPTRPNGRAESRRDSRTGSQDDARRESRGDAKYSSSSKDRKADIKGKSRVLASSDQEDRSRKSEKKRSGASDRDIPSTIPAQFPGQAPQEYSKPAFSQSGEVGAAAEFYGSHDAYLASVAAQPGNRPYTPIAINPQPHLHAPSAQPAPPQETGSGAANEFYSTQQTSTSNYQSTSYQSTTNDTQQQGSSSRPSKQSRPSAAGITAASAFANTSYSAQRPSASTSSRPPARPSKQSSSSSNIPLAAAGAAGLSAAAMHHYHHHQTHHAGSTTGSGTRPSSYTSLPPSGANGRHEEKGALGSLMEWWADYEDVRKMEEYTQLIGVCRYCFDHDAPYWEGPREHRPRKRKSREFQDRTRIDKDSRYTAAEDERRKRRSGGMTAAAAAAAGLAGYAAYEAGSSSRRHDEVDDYSRQSTYRRESEERRRRRSSERRTSKTSSRRESVDQVRRQSGSRSRPTQAELLGTTIAGGAAVSMLGKRRDSASASSDSNVSSSGEDAGFFSRIFSPGSKKKERRRLSQPRKRRSGNFYGFSNASVDTGLAYGGGASTVSYNGSKRHQRRKSSDNFDPTKTLLGLGTAAAALAAAGARRENKGYPATGALHRHGVPPAPHRFRSQRREEEDDEWESESDSASHASSNLAFGDGLPSSPSSDSLASSDSGTNKWDWRWGSKKKRRSSRDKVSLPLAEAAGVSAAGAAYAAHETPTKSSQMPSRRVSSNAPLQEIDPLPIADSHTSSRRRRDSVNTPIVRPSDVPLQHPKPVSPPKPYPVAQPPSSNIGRMPGAFVDSEEQPRRRPDPPVTTGVEDYQPLKRQSTEPVPADHRKIAEESSRVQRRRRTSSPTPDRSDRHSGDRDAALAGVAAAGLAAGAYALSKRRDSESRNRKEKNKEDSGNSDDEREQRRRRRESRRQERQQQPSVQQQKQHRREKEDDKPQPFPDYEGPSPPASAIMPNKSMASITPSESASQYVPPHSDSEEDEPKPAHSARVFEPNVNDRAHEPIFDDEIFDPNLFKRPRSDSQDAKKVFEDFTKRYEEKTPSMAEFFAPTEILNGPAPVDRRVDAEISSSGDERPYNRRSRSDSQVPRLKVIPATPPHSVPASRTQSANPSPLHQAADVETELPSNAPTASRVRWGDSEINVYQVESPESFRDKEYFPQTVEDSANQRNGGTTESAKSAPRDEPSRTPSIAAPAVSEISRTSSKQSRSSRDEPPKPSAPAVSAPSETSRTSSKQSRSSRNGPPVQQSQPEYKTPYAESISEASSGNRATSSQASWPLASVVDQAVQRAHDEKTSENRSKRDEPPANTSDSRPSPWDFYEGTEKSEEPEQFSVVSKKSKKEKKSKRKSTDKDPRDIEPSTDSAQDSARDTQLGNSSEKEQKDASSSKGGFANIVGTAVAGGGVTAGAEAIRDTFADGRDKNRDQSRHMPGSFDDDEEPARVFSEGRDREPSAPAGHTEASKTEDEAKDATPDEWEVPTKKSKKQKRRESKQAAAEVKEEPAPTPSKEDTPDEWEATTTKKGKKSKRRSQADPFVFDEADEAIDPPTTIKDEAMPTPAKDDTPDEWEAASSSKKSKKSKRRSQPDVFAFEETPEKSEDLERWDHQASSGQNEPDSTGNHKISEANAEDEWESQPRKKDKKGKKPKRNDNDDVFDQQPSGKSTDVPSTSEEDWQSRASKRRAERRSMDSEAKPVLMKPTMSFADTVEEAISSKNKDEAEQAAPIRSEKRAEEPSNMPRRLADDHESPTRSKESRSSRKDDVKSSVSAPLERSTTYDDYTSTSARRDKKLDSLRDDFRPSQSEIAYRPGDMESNISQRSTSHRSYVYSPERRPKDLAKADDYSFKAPPMARSSSDGPSERRSKSSRHHEEKEPEKERRRSGIFGFLDRRSSEDGKGAKSSSKSSSISVRDDASVMSESKRSKHDKSSKRRSLNDATLDDYASVVGSMLSKQSSHSRRERADSTGSRSRSRAGRRRSEDYETGTSSRAKVNPTSSLLSPGSTDDQALTSSQDQPGSRPADQQKRVTEALIYDVPELVRLPESRPDSPTEEPGEKQHVSDSTPKSTRESSTTAVPFRFRKPPLSPNLTRQSPVQSPVSETPPSPMQKRVQRPPSTEFKSSHEFRPLYLLERTRKPAEVEENLPSLPSSHSNSRTSSVHGSNDDYFESARESPSPSQSDVEYKSLDPNAEQAEEPDFLDSQQPTPKAGSQSPAKEDRTDGKSHSRKKSGSSSHAGILAAGGLAAAAALAAKARQESEGDATFEDADRDSRTREVLKGTEPGPAQADGEEPKAEKSQSDAADDEWAAPKTKAQKKKDKKTKKSRKGSVATDEGGEAQAEGTAHAEDVEKTPRQPDIDTFESEAGAPLSESQTAPQSAYPGLGISFDEPSKQRETPTHESPPRETSQPVAASPSEATLAEDDWEVPVKTKSKKGKKGKKTAPIVTTELPADHPEEDEPKTAIAAEADAALGSQGIVDNNGLDGAAGADPDVSVPSVESVNDATPNEANDDDDEEFWAPTKKSKKDKKKAKKAAAAAAVVVAAATAADDFKDPIRSEEARTTEPAESVDPAESTPDSRNLELSQTERDMPVQDSIKRESITDPVAAPKPQDDATSNDLPAATSDKKSSSRSSSRDSQSRKPSQERSGGWFSSFFSSKPKDEKRKSSPKRSGKEIETSKPSKEFKGEETEPAASADNVFQYQIADELAQADGMLEETPEPSNQSKIEPQNEQRPEGEDSAPSSSTDNEPVEAEVQFRPQEDWSAAQTSARQRKKERKQSRLRESFTWEDLEKLEAERAQEEAKSQGGADSTKTDEQSAEAVDANEPVDVAIQDETAPHIEAKDAAALMPLDTKAVIESEATSDAVADDEWATPSKKSKKSKRDKKSRSVGTERAPSQDSSGSSSPIVELLDEDGNHVGQVALPAESAAAEAYSKEQILDADQTTLEEPLESAKALAPVESQDDLLQDLVESSQASVDDGSEKHKAAAEEDDDWNTAAKSKKKSKKAKKQQALAEAAVAAAAGAAVVASNKQDESDDLQTRGLKELPGKPVEKASPASNETKLENDSSAAAEVDADDFWTTPTKSNKKKGKKGKKASTFEDHALDQTIDAMPSNDAAESNDQALALSDDKGLTASGPEEPLDFSSDKAQTPSETQTPPAIADDEWSESPMIGKKKSKKDKKKRVSFADDADWSSYREGENDKQTSEHHALPSNEADRLCSKDDSVRNPEDLLQEPPDDKPDVRSEDANAPVKAGAEDEWAPTPSKKKSKQEKKKKRVSFQGYDEPAEDPTSEVATRSDTQEAKDVQDTPQDTPSSFQDDLDPSRDQDASGKTSDDQTVDPIATTVAPDDEWESSSFKKKKNKKDKKKRSSLPEPEPEASPVPKADVPVSEGPSAIPEDVHETRVDDSRAADAEAGLAGIVGAAAVTAAADRSEPVPDDEWATTSTKKSKKAKKVEKKQRASAASWADDFEEPPAKQEEQVGNGPMTDFAAASDPSESPETNYHADEPTQPADSSREQVSETRNREQKPAARGKAAGDALTAAETAEPAQDDQFAPVEDALEGLKNVPAQEDLDLVEAGGVPGSWDDAEDNDANAEKSESKLPTPGNVLDGVEYLGPASDELPSTDTTTEKELKEHAVPESWEDASQIPDAWEEAEAEQDVVEGLKDAPITPQLRDAEEGRFHFPGSFENDQAQSDEVAMSASAADQSQERDITGTSAKTTPPPEEDEWATSSSSKKKSKKEKKKAKALSWVDDEPSVTNEAEFAAAVAAAGTAAHVAEKKDRASSEHAQPEEGSEQLARLSAPETTEAQPDDEWAPTSNKKKAKKDKKKQRQSAAPDSESLPEPDSKELPKDVAEEPSREDPLAEEPSQDPENAEQDPEEDWLASASSNKKKSKKDRKKQRASLLNDDNAGADSPYQQEPKDHGHPQLFSTDPLVAAEEGREAPESAEEAVPHADAEADEWASTASSKKKGKKEKKRAALAAAQLESVEDATGQAANIDPTTQDSIDAPDATHDPDQDREAVADGPPEDEASTPSSNKKKSKKERKREALDAELIADIEEEVNHPSETTVPDVVVEEPTNEAVEDFAADTAEDDFTALPGKKLSKKEKKRLAVAAQQAEQATQEAKDDEPSTGALPTGQTTLAETKNQSGAASEVPPADDEWDVPVSKKKKSKKDKKRGSLAAAQIAEPEADEETAKQVADNKQVEGSEPSTHTPQVSDIEKLQSPESEIPPENDEWAVPVSKKKSKKDKKRASLAVAQYTEADEETVKDHAIAEDVKLEEPSEEAPHELGLEQAVAGDTDKHQPAAFNAAPEDDEWAVPVSKKKSKKDKKRGSLASARAAEAGDEGVKEATAAVEDVAVPVETFATAPPSNDEELDTPSSNKKKSKKDKKQASVAAAQITEADESGANESVTAQEDPVLAADAPADALTDAQPAVDDGEWSMPSSDKKKSKKEKKRASRAAAQVEADTDVDKSTAAPAEEFGPTEPGLEADRSADDYFGPQPIAQDTSADAVTSQRSDAQEADADETFAPVTSKKKAKKNKKQTQAFDWSAAEAAVDQPTEDKQAEDEAAIGKSDAKPIESEIKDTDIPDAWDVEEKTDLADSHGSKSAREFVAPLEYTKKHVNDLEDREKQETNHPSEREILDSWDDPNPLDMPTLRQEAGEEEEAQDDWFQTPVKKSKKKGKSGKKTADNLEGTEPSNQIGKQEKQEQEEEETSNSQKHESGGNEVALAAAALAGAAVIADKTKPEDESKPTVTREMPAVQDVDDFAPVSGKKSKKNKKARRQSLAWDEPLDQDEPSSIPAADVPSVNESKAPAEELPSIEQQSVDATTKPTTAPEPQQDDFAPVTTKKGKKGKKAQAQAFDWNKPEASSELVSAEPTDASFATDVATTTPDGLGSAQKVEYSTVPEEDKPAQEAGEDHFAPATGKKGKKGKKAKKQVLAWEEEEEASKSPSAETADVAPATDVARAAIEDVEMKDPTIEPTPNFDQDKPAQDANEDDFAPVTAKKVKKGKKAKKEAFAWDEPEDASEAGSQQSADKPPAATGDADPLIGTNEPLTIPGQDNRAQDAGEDDFAPVTAKKGKKGKKARKESLALESSQSEAQPEAELSNKEPSSDTPIQSDAAMEASVPESSTQERSATTDKDVHESVKETPAATQDMTIDEFPKESKAPLARRQSKKEKRKLKKTQEVDTFDDEPQATDATPSASKNPEAEDEFAAAVAAGLEDAGFDKTLADAHDAQAEPEADEFQTTGKKSKKASKKQRKMSALNWADDAEEEAQKPKAESSSKPLGDVVFAAMADAGDKARRNEEQAISESASKPSKAVAPGKPLENVVFAAMAKAGNETRQREAQSEASSATGKDTLKSAGRFGDVVLDTMAAAGTTAQETPKQPSPETQRRKGSFEDIVMQAMDQVGFDPNAVSRKTSKERLEEDSGVMDFGPTTKRSSPRPKTGRTSPSSMWQSSTSPSNSKATSRRSSPEPKSSAKEAGLAGATAAAALAAGAFLDGPKASDSEQANAWGAVKSEKGKKGKKGQSEMRLEKHEETAKSADKTKPEDVSRDQTGGWSWDSLEQRHDDNRDSAIQAHGTPSLPKDQLREAARDSGFVDAPTTDEAAQHESARPAPIEAETKDRSSDLFKSPPSNRTSMQSAQSPASAKDSPQGQQERSHGRTVSRDLAPIREESPNKKDRKQVLREGDDRRGAGQEESVPPSLRHLLTAEGRKPPVSPSPAKEVTVSKSPSVRERAAMFGGPSSPSDMRRPTGRTPSNESKVMESMPRSYSALSNRSVTPGSRSGTPGLRRMDRSVSSDLRAVSRRDAALTGSDGGAKPSDEATHAPADHNKPANYSPLRGIGKDRQQSMSDAGSFEGWGTAASPRSPSRPQSIRKRQSTHILDLERQLEQALTENRQLSEARDRSSRTPSEVFYPPNANAAKEELRNREIQLREKDVEINGIKASLATLEAEVARLTEHNNELQAANSNLASDTNARYATLQKEHADAHERFLASNRELDVLKSKHTQLTSGMEDVVRGEINAALADKDEEIHQLRSQLERATDRIQSLQRQVASTRRSEDYLTYRDEDYFESACQQLCQHVQQWVLRFSKFSDTRACRLSSQVKDEKIETRLDNAVLDGSDVDDYLRDRVRRRDVFMSVVMTMIWEFVFTRYLFGMDRDQRQKLKSLEKTLTEVGPGRAVAQWRATTLTLLSRREAFQEQKAQDTEAVVQEVLSTLNRLLPPPGHLIQQIEESLRNVMRLAVSLSIEMRTQRAEYIMLPPLQPEYDTNGDLARKVFFNADLMNERSGQTTSNQELENQQAVVRIVLFPLVVKKGNDMGETDDEIVVCPAQVLIARPGTDKKVVRVMSGPTNASMYSVVPSAMDNPI